MKDAQNPFRVGTQLYRTFQILNDQWKCNGDWLNAETITERLYKTQDFRSKVASAIRTIRQRGRDLSTFRIHTRQRAWGTSYRLVPTVN